MMLVKLTLFFFVALLGTVTSRECGEWRWKDKVAVVTGASSGMGAEIALALADRGVIVVGLARREEKIKELSKKTTGTIHAIKCDLLNEEEVTKAFLWVEQTLGGVDILINNAGVLILSSLINGNTSDWRTVLDLNVLSMSVCTREALHTMRTRGDDGHIININSLAGHKVPKFKHFLTGLYPASKFAVTALTESLAFELSELSSNIKVTSLSPGLVSTELTFKIGQNLQTQNNGVPSPFNSLPFIEPVDIAEAVLYILGTRPNVLVSELTIHPIAKPICSVPT